MNLENGWSPRLEQELRLELEMLEKAEPFLEALYSEAERCVAWTLRRRDALEEVLKHTPSEFAALKIGRKA